MMLPNPRQKADLELHQAIELSKLYRDSAYRMFTLRTYATYFNLIAAGAVTAVAGQSIPNMPTADFQNYLSSHSVIYILGIIILFCFSGWATATVVILTNSVNRYLALATHIESTKLHVDYAPYQRRGGGVTVEFQPDFLEEIQSGISTSIWNTINASVAAYAAILLATLGYNMGQTNAAKSLFVLGSIIYVGLVAILIYFSLAPSERKASAVAKGMIKKWWAFVLFIAPFAMLFLAEGNFGHISPWEKALTTVVTSHSAHIAHLPHEEHPEVKP